MSGAVVRERIMLALWSVGLAVALWFLHSIGAGDLAPPPVADLDALRSWPNDVGLEAAVLSLVRVAGLQEIAGLLETGWFSFAITHSCVIKA